MHTSDEPATTASVGIDISLGRYLRDVGAFGLTSLDRASRDAMARGTDLGSMLVEAGSLPVSQLMRALEACTGLRCLDPRRIEFDPDAVMEFRTLFSPGELREMRALPLRWVDDCMDVLLVDPLDRGAINRIHRRSGCRVRPAIAIGAALDARRMDLFPESDPIHLDGGIDGALERVRGQLGADVEAFGDVTRASRWLRGRAAVHVFVQEVLCTMIREGVSDLHVEPRRTETRIRTRIDGALHDERAFPRWAGALVATRVRQMSRLAAPGDGCVRSRRVDYPVLGDDDLDLRVTVLPGIHGEDVAIRVLDRTRARRSLASLGYPPSVVSALRSALALDSGLVLVAGPTGSGKTTTLYACLNELVGETRKIVSLEDPVEYQIDGVTQVSIEPDSVHGFAPSIHTLLRMDVDVVMIGELRDPESVQAALRAALTGHLVIATIHAPDAAGVVTRLLDLGIDPFALGSSLRLVLAQRLLERPCGRCDTNDRRQRQSHGSSPTAPCPACRGTKQAARQLIAECLVVDRHLQRLIVDRAGPLVLRQAAEAAGLVPLEVRAREWAASECSESISIVDSEGSQP